MKSINSFSANKRIAWIDNVKFFAIWCVIFGHFNGLLFTHGRPGFGFVNLLIVVFNMPLFVLMSGYSNYHSLIRIDNIMSLAKYIKNAILYIALPCIIPSLLAYVIRDCQGVLSFKHYWFLVMLFIMQVTCGLCFYVSSKLNRANREWIAWTVFSLAMIMLDKYSTSDLFFYYLLGGIAKRIESKGCSECTVVKNNFMIALACCVALCIFPFVGKYQFYYDTIYSLYHEGKIYIWFLRVFDACLFCYVIIALTMKYSSKYNLLSFVGSKTLGLYIFTGLIIDICLRYKIMIDDDSMFSWLSSTIISFAATFVALLIILLLESNKYTRFLFFGK